ncbi:MAG: FG-GAP-like repeat-containing protein [Ferruginibacter sp.]
METRCKHDIGSFETSIILLVLLLPFGTSIAQPFITGLSPSSGPAGTVVTITGTGFSPISTNNIVNLGGIKTSVNSTNASSIKFTVPTGISASVPLTVTANGLTAFSPVSFVTTFAGSGSFKPGTFTNNSSIALQTFTQSMAISDMDGDNKPDLVTTHPGDSSFSVYKNSGTSTAIGFAAGSDFKSNIPPYSIAVGDLDGDGFPDIVVGSSDYSSANNISVFRNTTKNGILSFALKGTYTIPAPAYNIVIGEIDGDGKPEIITTVNNGIFVLQNTSVSATVSFSEGIYFSAGQYPSDLAIADINGNGKADMVICDGNGRVLILNNISTSGTISFDAPIPFSTGNGGEAMAVGDLDNDGRADIVVAQFGQYSLAILKNTGAGNVISFAPHYDLNVGHQTWGVKMADMDGDSKLDIVCSNYDLSYEVSLFRNISTASLSFEPPVYYYTGGKNWKLIVSDLRNSGIPDIAVLQNEIDKIATLRNKNGEPPVLTSFTPSSAGQGAPITIKGSNLFSVTAVSFGGVAATDIKILSDTSIRALVSAGSSGAVNLITPAGSATLPGFVFKIAPSFTSFTPSGGPVGQVVKIIGTNFSTSVAGNAVYFGGAKANIISATASTLMVTVPVNAMFQPISVTSNGYSVYSNKPFHVTFPDGNLNLSTFIKKIDQYDGYASIMLNASLADIDGDGKTDIIVSLTKDMESYGEYRDSIAVYRNTSVNGAVSFAPRVIFSTSGVITFDVTTGDFDGDGKIDIAAVSQSYTGGYNGIDIFRNTSTPGTISFEVPVPISGGFNPYQVISADMNGDGKPDLVVAAGSDIIYVFKNISSGSTILFDALQSFRMVNGSASSVCAGDLDGDGKPEVIASSTTIDSIVIFKNISTIGTIKLETAPGCNAGRRTTFVTMGDMDGDGKQDIVTGTGFYNYAGLPFIRDTGIIVARNLSTTGNFNFAPPGKVLHCYPWNIVVTDLDGDGKTDLLSTDRNDSLAIFKNTRNTSNSSFSKLSYLLPNNYVPKGSAAGDLDGDGKPDIVIIDNNIVRVLINQNGSDIAICPNGDSFLFSNIGGTIYQWQVNTGSGYFNISDNLNYSGTNTIKLTLNNIPSAWYGYQYKCVVSGTDSKTFTIKFVNQWTGAVNSAWENTGNWSCGVLPEINTDVVISTGSVTINSNVIVRSLKLDPDVILAVNPIYRITISH